MSMRTALQPTRAVCQSLGSTRVLYQETKPYGDPFEYHTADETSLWSRVRKALVVNP